MRLLGKLLSGLRDADTDAVRRGLAPCRECSGTGALAAGRHELACDRVPCSLCAGTGAIRVLVSGQSVARPLVVTAGVDHA